MQATCQSATAQSRLLDEAITRTQGTVKLSSGQIQNLLESQGQAYRVHIGRLGEGIKQTQRAIADLSESGISEMQVATHDIKQAFSNTATSIAESNTALIEAMAQDVEARITKSTLSRRGQRSETCSGGGAASSQSRAF
jgi:hypothetical protein